MTRPATLGELKRTGYRPRSVKDEMRENLIRKLREGEAIFPGILGYDDTVIPQVTNAILARHDMLFLGLRGQAKTRMVRALPALLDEYAPAVSGCDVMDDPLDPKFRRARAIVDEHGDATPIRWFHRNERYHEKLATPDVTVADLIGEIDLVKHAEGRYLNDEEVMHFGLIPRTHRGIFAINELPDLAPRIQVAMFNVLEERDVQIRGFPVRLPLDLCVVFTANPEDYTNRGRIVTPLKDRIGSVVRTHYPVKSEHGIAITRENAWLERSNGAYEIAIPDYMLEIIEEAVRLARKSPHINQQSGVSVRTSIACSETMVSNAERRAVTLGERRIVPRICDLANMSASCRGKIELMLAEDEQAEDKLITALVGEAVSNVLESYMNIDDLDAVIEAFQGSKTNLQTGDEMSAEQLVGQAHKIRPLAKAASHLCQATNRDPDDPGELAGAVEFILESLYVNNRLSKYAYQRRTFFKR